MEAETKRTRAQRLSDAAFAWLQERDAELQVKEQLPFDEALQVVGFQEFRIIRNAYLPTITRISQGPLGLELVDLLLEHLTTELARDIEEREQAENPLIERAFDAEYCGDVDERFAVYLEQCWTEYTECPQNFVAPYVTIVQSSGFGKSRLVKQLALAVNTSTLGSTRKLFYTCFPREGGLSDFPSATPALNAFFFPVCCPDEREIAWRLFVAFEYANEHWDSLGDEWMQLFTSRGLSSDKTIAHALMVALSCEQHKSKRAKLLRQADEHQSTVYSIDFKEDAGKTPRVLLFVVDEARALLEGQETFGGERADWWRLLRRALALANQFVSEKHRSNCVEILGIFVDSDPKIASCGVAAAPSMRRALPVADPSSRAPAPAFPNKVLFSPFVLTHTLDVHQKKAIRSHGAGPARFYQTIVAAQMANPWPSLSEMGRPLWRSFCSDPSAGDSAKWVKNAGRMVDSAASKLLAGYLLGYPESFSPETMFGVASLLCRLGLRPYVSSPFASRAVANFMAVLAYVSFEHDKLVASFSSDPILAFGAASLWHSKVRSPFSTASPSTGQCPLATWILPQFRKLLFQDVVDTGGIGEVVARILLLLAIDACGPMASGRFHAPDCANFCSVPLFVETLLGRSPGIKHRNHGSGKTASAALAELQVQWADWKMGFSHFVQLPSEPTELCLWTMLSRRAAGILPRDNASGVDLVIPVFAFASSEASSATGDASESNAQESLILVGVSGGGVGWCMDTSSGSFDEELELLSSATRAMDPSRVFSSENCFHRYDSRQVLRVHMSLPATGTSSNSSSTSSEQPKRSPTRFLFVDEPPQCGGTDDAGIATLYLEGVVDCGESDDCGESEDSNASESGAGRPLGFVSPGMAEQLEALLRRSSWDPVMERVEANVAVRRACLEGKSDWVARGAALLSDEELVEGAKLSALCGG